MAAAAAAILICGTPSCWSQQRDPAVPQDVNFLTVLLHQDLPIRIPFGLPLDSRCQAKKEGDREGSASVVRQSLRIRMSPRSISRNPVFSNNRLQICGNKGWEGNSEVYTLSSNILRSSNP